ncbi:diguanylate cyclase/phosphodiesterase with PAS/PAC sensor(s) [Methylobacter tundripaludum]|uniref:cyclic-guanylate-specific phosphodiesterase n=1 Tax=Methylobacter tundripaludum TaxID=173365 RepID=A0A2S6HFK3_9GAMM|nr:EAL domain-containing protein [Methylobacter tundripaludum]PPK76258.1 diguanylate cyclase/phosphodiesterase with PAS/PAC sensor(s) [Methylobacter tundripaludum]
MSNFDLHAISIKDITQTSLLTCLPNETMHDAAVKMVERNCSAILIAVDDEIIGIWTERDVLKFDFSSPDARSTPVSEGMSSPVICVNENASLEEVSLKFKKDGVRHYVVIDDHGKQRGIISQTDVIKKHNFEFFLVLKTAGSVLKPIPPMIQSTQSMAQASKLMHSSHSDAIRVEFPDESIGILTERDVVKALASLMLNPIVADHASSDLVTVNEHESLYHAKKIMLLNGFRHLGVSDNKDNLIGIINLTDILAGFRSTYVEELKESLAHRDVLLRDSLKSLGLAKKIIDNTQEGVITTDKYVVIQTCNAGFTKITGYTEEEVIGKTPGIISSGRHDKNFYYAMWEKINKYGFWQGEIWNRRKNGEVYPELLTITEIRDDETNEISNYAAIFSDISQLKSDEEEIKRLAFYDPLTELPNRRLLNDRLAQELAITGRSGKNGALLFIDLDHFKNINETLGHSAGDRVLVEVAYRLKQRVRDCDTAARISSDEFVVILTELNGQIELACNEARYIAEKLQQTICQVYSVMNHKLYISSSIGIAMFSENSDVPPDDLLKQAGTAMYRAKESGRNMLQFFQDSMQEAAMERMLIEKELRQALDENQLSLYYQPQVDYHGTLMGAEALIRWNHPKKGFIPPDKFIPIAEECGLIQAVGAWVLEQSFIHLRQWDRLQVHLPHLAINISPRQFYHDDFMDILGRLVKRYQISPSRIMLEFTEGLLMNDVDVAIDKIKQLKKLGYTFSIDDFGTGYSSLSYLKHLPVDQLKIDKSFVEDITKNEDDAVFVGTIIAIARHMNLGVVAEGVESKMELEFLKQNGCLCYQGYYFSKPLPEGQFFEHWLRKAKQ